MRDTTFNHPQQDTMTTTTPHHSQPSQGQLNLAYGSNLSPTQMSLRCPSSCTPLAIAKLSSYSWFICQPGYANIIPLPPVPPHQETHASTIYGVIYHLTPEDETRLDGFEGWSVAKRGSENMDPKTRKRKPFEQGSCSYNKLYLKVEIVKWLVDHPERFTSQERDLEDLARGVITTMVYVDEVRTSPGRIKDEYVGRMSRAVLESVPLGIPERWVDENMRRHGIVWSRGETSGKRSGSGGIRTAPPVEEWEEIRERYLLDGVGGERSG